MPVNQLNLIHIANISKPNFHRAYSWSRYKGQQASDSTHAGGVETAACQGFNCYHQPWLGLHSSLGHTSQVWTEHSGWGGGGACDPEITISSFVNCFHLYCKTEAFEAELFIQVGSSALILTTKLRTCAFIVEKKCASFSPGSSSTGKAGRDSSVSSLTL